MPGNEPALQRQSSDASEDGALALDAVSTETTTAPIHPSPDPSSPPLAQRPSPAVTSPTPETSGLPPVATAPDAAVQRSPAAAPPPRQIPRPSPDPPAITAPLSAGEIIPPPSNAPSPPTSGTDALPGSGNLPASTAPAATETLANPPLLQRTSAAPAPPDASHPPELTNSPDPPVAAASAAPAISPSLPSDTSEQPVDRSDSPSLQRQAEPSSANQVAAGQPLSAIDPPTLPLATNPSPPTAPAPEGRLHRRQVSPLSPAAPRDSMPETVETEPGSEVLAIAESTVVPQVVQRQTAPISPLSTPESPLENAARSEPGTFQPASTVPGTAAPESISEAKDVSAAFASGSAAVVPIQAKRADGDSPEQLPQAAPMPAAAPVEPADTGNDRIQRQTTAEVAFPPPSLDTRQPIAGGEGPASVVDRKVDAAIAPTSTAPPPEATRPEAQPFTEAGDIAPSLDPANLDALSLDPASWDTAQPPAPATLQRRSEDTPAGDEGTATAALPATLPPSADPPPPDLSVATANALEGTETSPPGIDDVERLASSPTAGESLSPDALINRRAEPDTAVPIPIASPPPEGTAFNRQPEPDPQSGPDSQTVQTPSDSTQVDSSLGSSSTPESVQRRPVEPPAGQRRSQPEPPAASTPALDSAAGSTGSISAAEPANPTVPPSEKISAEQADVDTTDRGTGDPGAMVQRSLSATELTAPSTQLPEPVSATPPISNQPQTAPPEVSGTQIAEIQAAASSPLEDFATAPTTETPADLVIQRRDLPTHPDPALPTENLAPSSTPLSSPISPADISGGEMSSTSLDTASPAAIPTIQTFMDPSHAGDQQSPSPPVISAKVDSPAQDVTVAHTEPLSPQPSQLETDVNESPPTIRALDNKRENLPVDSPQRQPAQSPEVTFPSLPAVLTSLSVIQPFRLPETAPMQITNPARLALPSAPAPSASATSPVVPPMPTTAVISPEVGPPATPTVQRDAPPAASATDLSALTGESQTLAPPSPESPVPLSPTANPPQVQRQAAQSTSSSLAWGDVAALLNAPIPQKDSDKTRDRPPSSLAVASPNPTPYPDLKPFQTLQRQLAQPGANVIQRDESAYATTITAQDFEALPTDASPETLELLVQQVYGLICQRLAVERERHGLFHRR
ncbi:MAG: hypothetical protein HC812_00930 [Leptolyngbya sp. RL_3_1]|nr:hypothetical protein [Leptolyngbya sp. RL_3_1]